MGGIVGVPDPDPAIYLMMVIVLLAIAGAVWAVMSHPLGREDDSE